MLGVKLDQADIVRVVTGPELCVYTSGLYIILCRCSALPCKGGGGGGAGARRSEVGGAGNDIKD